MATYRMLAYVPTRATIPGDGAPTDADPAEVLLARRAARAFPADMALHSTGMCQVDLSVRVLTEALPETVYDEREGQQMIHPNQLADHVGDLEEYDGFLCYNPSALTTATTFRGLGGTTSGTPFLWVKVGESDERAIAVHEFGHALTVYLGTVTAEYTNFPVCGGEPAMHCGAEYGFADDLDPAWLTGFMSGTLSDGTGINATGWAVQTPSERGDKQQASYRTTATPWGRLGPLRIGGAA